MARDTSTTGVLLMAYGAVEDLDDIEAYFTDIRRGKTPSPEAVEDLRSRYETIGGRSPLREITERQARALAAKLNDGEGNYRIFVGMRHWHPFIREVVENEIAGSDVDRLVALVLAPHYSKMSVAAYFQRLEEALEGLDDAPEVLGIDDYHDHPAFIAAIAEGVNDKLAEFAAEAGEDLEATKRRVKVIFSAHSLPERILETGDPYKDQLLESSRLVAEACGGLDWEFAFQSASGTGIPWLGPDILDKLEEVANAGQRDVLVVPIGFICDHLEILFDVDVECFEVAEKRGLNLRRTEMPNDRPAFVEALSQIVRDRLAVDARA